MAFFYPREKGGRILAAKPPWLRVYGETMPKTASKPETHGFAFANSLEFTHAEQGWLHDKLVVALGSEGIHSVTGVGAVGKAFVLRGIRVMLEDRLSEAPFGLCGRMRFPALDYFKSQRQAPRGQGPEDWPLPFYPLRDHIWQRQVDSFAIDMVRI